MRRLRRIKEQSPHQQGKEREMDTRFDMEALPSSLITIDGEDELLHSAGRRAASIVDRRVDDSAAAAVAKPSRADDDRLRLG